VAGIDFQNLFHALPGLFLVLRPAPAFTIVAVSDAYLSAMQMRREEIMGRDFFEVIFETSRCTAGGAASALRVSLERAMERKAPDATVVERCGVGGSMEGRSDTRFWSALTSPILSDEGQVEFLIHRMDDVTDTLRVERSLREANRRFQAIYDQGLFAGCLDLNGTLLDVNRSCLEQCGYVREDVIGKPFWECGWWNRSAQIQAWVKRAVDQAVRGEVFRGETRYFLADGSERVVDFACMPIKDDAGQVLFVVPTGMDITERVRADRELRATEILDSITEGFCSLSRDWCFTYVNREALRLLDRASNELIGKVLWDVYPHLLGSEFEHAYRRTMNERTESAITAFYPDHDRWYEVHTYAAPHGMLIYFRDVTAQKRAGPEREQLIAESEKQRRIYEAALSNTPDLVYVFDLDHRFIYANEALLEMWGKTRDDALGKTCLELGYEPWHAEMHDREIDQVIATRRSIRGEVPFTGTQGRRIYEYIFVPVAGLEGEVVAIAGTTRDVTDRHEAEQAIRHQAERLRESDRMKDEFLATLSHELRNPLAPLRNSLHLLRTSGRRSPATAQLHEMMERQVDHLVRLVDDLLEMSRISRGTLTLRSEEVEVAAIVRNAVEISEPLVRSAGHELSVSLPAGPLWLHGDPVRLSQILGNLLNNAAIYTQDGGRIELQARRDRDHVVISVRDNGCGLAPETLARMFEMFSRGERPSSRGQAGLGIGLALARRLTELHGGTIAARSEGPDRGSELTLRLPLSSPPEPSSEPCSAREQPALPSARILVVDDNRDAADSLSMILEFLGAEVRIAHDGHEALQQLETYDPHLVLLDIGMPGMDGYEVARRIRARFPERRAAIVALTGWGQDEDRRKAQEAGFDHHLLKPAEIDALRSLLSSLKV